MRRITHKGNLPNHLKVLATQLGGRLKSVADTEFYEANSITEFENRAQELGYEIVPTVDTSTGRGFLVGFDVKAPEKVATLLDYSSLQIYFRECSASEIEAWTKKIKEHRNDQQFDMRERREKAQAKLASRKKDLRILK